MSVPIKISIRVKPEYFLFKSFWSEKPTVRIAIEQKQKGIPEIISKWNWKTNDSLIVNVYSNCDQVELFLNNKSVGKKTVNKNEYFAAWPIIYKAGTLKAVGYKSGKKVTEDVIVTAGEATGLVAKITKNNLLANGNDMSLIEINLVDKNGNPVHDADNTVTVKVTGAGSFAGLDTGDMLYTGVYKTNVRKAHQGRLMLSVKSSTVPGKIFVELKSDKIDSLKLQLQTY